MPAGGGYHGDDAPELCRRPIAVDRAWALCCQFPLSTEGLAAQQVGPGKVTLQLSAPDQLAPITADLIADAAQWKQTQAIPTPAAGTAIRRCVRPRPGGAGPAVQRAGVTRMHSGHRHWPTPPAEKPSGRACTSSPRAPSRHCWRRSMTPARPAGSGGVLSVAPSALGAIAPGRGGTGVADPNRDAFGREKNGIPNRRPPGPPRRHRCAGAHCGERYHANG